MNLVNRSNNFVFQNIQALPASTGLYVGTMIGRPLYPVQGSWMLLSLILNSTLINDENINFSRMTVAVSAQNSKDIGFQNNSKILVKHDYLRGGPTALALSTSIDLSPRYLVFSANEPLSFYLQFQSIPVNPSTVAASLSITWKGV